MNEQIENTLQDQLLKTLFDQGLGEGLANIAQLLMNAAMLIERENRPSLRYRKSAKPRIILT